MPPTSDAATAVALARDPLDFPYTAQDTPEVRARIRADLQRIVDATRAADPSLHALVLTGGFSRGEGTVRAGRPVNDYDLVAVRTRPGGDALYRRIAAALTRDVGLEVDVMPIWRGRVPYVGPKLFWLDARLGGRVLWGDPDILRQLPPYEPRQIARGEVARLLGNRAAGLILALPGGEGPVDTPQVELQGAKAAIAAMDASLLADGRYSATLRGRLAASAGHPHHATFAKAVAWKLGDEAALGDGWWEECARVLLAAVDATGAESCRDGWTEKAFHLLRAHRWRASPSQAVRRAAWNLLRMSRFPEGPEPQRAVDVLAHAAGAPVSGAMGAGWPALRRAFFDIRARTLQ